MKKSSRANKGQFSIIAALLVSVILVTAVISAYSMVRHAPLQDSPKALTSIGEMNADIKRILDFTVGYYGSILKVTGNSIYAQSLATSYLSSGLVNIARSHPEWNPSFNLDFEQVSTRWYMPESYSVGNISVTYSLASLGIEGIKYETSSALKVTMLSSDSGVAQIKVTRDNTQPELGLSKENFWFYKYNYGDSTWELINPSDLIISSSGVYNLTIPSGVDQDTYSVQVEDNRGLMVTAFYSQNSFSSGIPHYTYNFDWNATGMESIYSSLSTDTMVIELLQNGTLRWLGQNLVLSPQAKPIPPVPAKALHVNATINGVNQQVPFQVEDWASSYRVPLGLSGNDTLFNNNNMLVFLVNNAVSEVTLWWDGNDEATQTPYAWQNIYFNDNPSNGVLDNGFLRLNIYNFYARSRVIGESTSYRADFLRVNDELPTYGAQPAYIIYNGVVRDIVQQEPEYSGGVAGCPNFYSQVFLTLPANTSYYTYTARTIFLNSLQSRSISDLSVIQLSDLSGTRLTEDGTSGGYPVTSSSTGLFYDGYPMGWAHHWSQFSSGNAGAGVMFTDVDNQNLYIFDSIAGDKTGALRVYSSSIEYNPVERYNAAFTYPLDLTWHGAVVTFSGEPIYTSPENDHVGLWVMVEHPPVITMDGTGTIDEPEGEPTYEITYHYVDNNTSDIDSSANKGYHSDFTAQQSGPDSIYDILTEAATSERLEVYVDNNTSDVDNSADIGSHSNFAAQQFGPDSIYDTLTEENTGNSSNVVLINRESFEGTWPPSGWSITGDWYNTSDQAYSGSYSAGIDGTTSGASGNLVTPDLDCSDAESIFVEFQFYDDGLDPNELLLEYFDGSSWVTIADLGTYSERTWNLYQHEITDSRYFVSNFKIRWRAVNVGVERWFLWWPISYEHAYVDVVTVTKEVFRPNYELDLEVQWTNVPDSFSNAYLSIYCGNMGDEDLAVDVWTGSGWETVFTDLTLGWNNVSITEWLSSSTFTIRFKDTDSIDDATPDTWQIDAVLISVWNEENYELDLEVQWTNVDYTVVNAELCIYVGEISGESLRVDFWTGSAWQTLFTGLNVGWNNVTISEYLTSSTFTIRFKGTNETGDTVQDYWTIDATLIRSWT